MKQLISGVVNNISTNPFQTFSSKRVTSSCVLSFDISFDLCNEDAKLTRVWFNRSFRFPPPLEDGDYIEVFGRFGRFMGLIGRRNFYSVRILDRRRGKEYTAWRNKVLETEASREVKKSSGAPAQTTY
ncbi:MAG: hypothetical protein JJE48_01910 [Actinobacteria bacterium]|nr:hypothetical protein [Actinomycetota bacterium]